MRNCLNCYNYENFYCNEKLNNINPYYCCDNHRFNRGEEEEKNYIFYDEDYLASGFFIVNIENGIIKKFLKFYRTEINEYYTYGIRVSDFNKYYDNEYDFHIIDFIFRDLEDYENSLYKIFNSLSNNIFGKTIKSMDNNNSFKIINNNGNIKLLVYKDIYNMSNFTDIVIGNKWTCECFNAFDKLYNELENACSLEKNNNEIKKLLLLKIKK